MAIAGTRQTDLEIDVTDAIFLNEKQAAERLGLAATTLARWRWSQKGPRFRKFGGAVRYALTDLDAFAEGGSNEAGAVAF